MPAGGEQRAREFYGKLLGLREVPKSPNPASHRGVWFQRDRLQLHLGATPDWPARTAIPILFVDDLRRAVAGLLAAGYAVEQYLDAHATLPHATTQDPFGNRIELAETRFASRG
jgi:catechol 2,3-dioxygenase-like lactoylglutathione lyase family enzyme